MQKTPRTPPRCTLAALRRCFHSPVHAQRVVEMLPEKNDPPEAIPVAISTKSQGFPEKTELVVACSCTAGGDSSLKYNQVPTLSWLALQTCG